MLAFKASSPKCQWGAKESDSCAIMRDYVMLWTAVKIKCYFLVLRRGYIFFKKKSKGGGIKFVLSRKLGETK